VKGIGPLDSRNVGKKRPVPSNLPFERVLGLTEEERQVLEHAIGLLRDSESYYGPDYGAWHKYVVEGLITLIGGEK